MAGQTLDRVAREREIGFPTQYGPVRGDKKPGHALVPHEVYRDTVVILLMTGTAFILTGLVIPELGRAANPFASPAFELPDWYLLWSWGLLQIVELFPPVTIFGITLGTLAYGAILSGIPFILLLILPFIDKGFESRPAKSNVRAAFGVAGMAWVTVASIYSVAPLVVSHFMTTRGSMVTLDTLRWMWILQPVQAGLVTFVATRRLGFKPMRRVNTVVNAGSFLIIAAATLHLLLLVHLLEGRNLAALVTAENIWLGFYVAFAVATGGVALYIVYFLDEATGRRTLFRWILAVVAILTPVTGYLMAFQQPIYDYVQVTAMRNGHAWIAFPVLSVLVAYFGQRTPYSDYEYKLNECYQCGRCHLVCPITKADADALGGLNLVYNVYKRQHDGVPMWACLTCDACSAVCPLDIDYSAYVLTERARAMRERRRIPERPAATTDGGQEV